MGFRWVSDGFQLLSVMLPTRNMINIGPTKAVGIPQQEDTRDGHGLVPTRQQTLRAHITTCLKI